MRTEVSREVPAPFATSSDSSYEPSAARHRELGLGPGAVPTRPRQRSVSRDGRRTARRCAVAYPVVVVRHQHPDRVGEPRHRGAELGVAERRAGPPGPTAAPTRAAGPGPGWCARGAPGPVVAEELACGGRTAATGRRAGADVVGAHHRTVPADGASRSRDDRSRRTGSRPRAAASGRSSPGSPTPTASRSVRHASYGRPAGIRAPGRSARRSTSSPALAGRAAAGSGRPRAPRAAWSRRQVEPYAGARARRTLSRQGPGAVVVTRSTPLPPPSRRRPAAQPVDGRGPGDERDRPATSRPRSPPARPSRRRRAAATRCRRTGSAGSRTWAAVRPEPARTGERLPSATAARAATGW